jgi:lipopolysaccharide biosynthesis glycosyltransferase
MTPKTSDTAVSWEMMHLALASNEAYFPGLLCAILSILSATQTAGGITIHILDGGIEDSSWLRLEGKVSLFGNEVGLARHRLALAKLEGLPLDRTRGVMMYARLLMPSLIEVDEVIYVDADMILFRDLREVWAEPLGDKLVAACQDYYTRVLADDPVSELTVEERKYWHFNSGFLKVNLKLWRQEDIQNRVLRLLRDPGAKCPWWDQSALNYLLRGRVKYLDRRWNRISFEDLTVANFFEDKINIHYITDRKPWINYDSSSPTFAVWRVFRAKWMPDIGRPKGSLEPLKAVCHDLWWGERCIAVRCRFYRLIEAIFWRLRLWKVSARLEWWRGQLEILRRVGNSCATHPMFRGMQDG